MGNYTEFHFNARLKENTPDQVLDVLKYMIDDEGEKSELPDHPFFKTHGWELMLQLDTVYFPVEACSVVYARGLSIRCAFKNYDNEIELFCNWIAPYLDADDEDFLGFCRFENDNEPELIYYKDIK